MEETIRYVGLDVHAETIAVAVAEATGEVRWLGSISNSPEAVRKLMGRLAPVERLRVCYEAGPCGYVLQRQLAEMGVSCAVIAPSLIPRRPGERIKTDRRDALKLARSLRAGELSAVVVPEAEREALRDLIRALETAKGNEVRARNRLGKFLLRQGRCKPKELRPWSPRHLSWIRAQRFEQLAQQAVLEDAVLEVIHCAERIGQLRVRVNEIYPQLPAQLRTVVEALQALRGVAQLGAITVVSELGTLGQFRAARQLMGYAGMVPSEHSSGARVRRGAITKTGNAHLRRVLVEAAWHYRHPPRVGAALRKRQAALSGELKALSF